MSQIDDFLSGKSDALQPVQSADQGKRIDSFLAGAESAPEPRGFKGWGRDIAATAVKGAIGVPEAIVGLADIPTGGAVGKFLENEGGAVGFRPKQAKEIVNDWHSDATKEAQKKFQAADGVGGKFMAAIENPSNIVTSVGESIPSMLAGGVAARGLMAATRLGQMGAKGAALAGAAGEGLTMAGSAAEQIRQETPDGLLTPTQAGLAAATGVVGGAIGALGGRVAQKLGIGDAETMLAQGQKGIQKEFADKAAQAAVNPLVQQQAVKSIPRQVIEGAISEGFLEELPQSVAEQVLQNLALGKDWLTDVDSAVVMGVLSGGAMGGAAAGYHGFKAPSQPAPSQNPAKPGQGPQPPKATTPGLDRVREAYNAQLQALQQQESGEPSVPQTTPPDGAAILQQQRAQAEAQRMAAIEASRAVQSPDDEIYQSTGAGVDPVRERVATAAAQGGSLSSAALTAIDTGATNAMQPAVAQPQPRAMSLEEADARDQAAYEQFWSSHDADPVVSRYFEDDNDIPDFDAASNVSDEEFLRALGATDEDIQDAIATASQSAIPQSRPAVDAGAQANEPAGTGQGAGGNQAAQGQVTPRQPDNFTGTPSATMGKQGATARPGPAFGLKDALAQIRAKKQQEAANAKAATPEAAPASTAVSAARPGAVEAAGVERSKLLASLDQTGATREMVLDAQLKDAQYRLAQITATTGILPADRASGLSAINQEIADLNAVRDQARALDERDRREGNTRSMLQSARQELDAAVRAGAVTPEAAQSIAAEAKKTGNAADAAKAVFTAVDSAVAAGPAPDIKAITAKQIPDMTDAELQVAIAHYGPEHKRTAKLQKEVQRRAGAPSSATNEGSTNGPQATQAQQTSPQPAQAGAAQSAAASSGAGAQAADGASTVRALSDGISVTPGKGLIKGKFLSSVDGDGTPGGPWATEGEARNAALQWRKTKATRAAEAVEDRNRKDSYLQKLRSGHTPTAQEVEGLGLRASGADLTYFIPRAADLFGITSREVRPLIADLIRVGHTDMGAKRESVNPMKALAQMARAGTNNTQSSTDGTTIENAGAQAAPAAGPQAAAQSGEVEALRQQLRDVEAKILQAAPAAMGQGGGDIEAAMKSRKVPVTLKAQRKKLKEQLRQSKDSQQNQPPAQSQQAQAATENAATQPVDSIFTGKPDAKNSAALDELEGFKPGDSVDVSGRTIGRSTIEMVYRRQMAGFGMMPMARVVGAGGKKLDVLLSELTRVEAAAEPTLDDQLKQINDELANQGTVQNARTRAKRDQIRTAIAERDFPAILKAVEGDVGSAEAINQALQFAGDEPKAKVIERVLKNRGISEEYRQRWAERLLDGQVDELDAEMQSYEDKATVSLRGKAAGDMLEMGNGTLYRIAGIDIAANRIRLVRNPDQLNERTVLVSQDDYNKLLADHEQTMAEAMARVPAPAPSAGVEQAQNQDAGNVQPPASEPVSAQKPAPKKKPSADQTRAKADLMNALADLGDILGKNTRMNIAPEQEQKLLPVLTRVLDAAFRLGYHKFKDSAKFALDQIREHLGADAADALTLDHLQGAYIAMAGGKQGADTKRAVIDVESKAEIEAHEATTAEEQAAVDNTEATSAESTQPGAEPGATEKETQDAGTSIRGAGTAPLEPVVAQDDAGAARGGDAGPRSADGQQGSGATGGRPDADGAATARSGGNGVAGRDPVQTGAGNSGSARKPGQVSRTARKRGAKATPAELQAEASEEIKQASPANVPGIDFTITDEVELGKGTEGVKFADNLAAIRTLKTIEQENRRATPEEQRTLARYVGWGGLKNAFRVAGAPREGSQGIAKGWESRVAQVEELLTPAELRAARNSTTAAHYTSQAVVQAIWKAVQRLGYRGGAVLEPSVGTGNFLGLMPAQLRGASKVFAVEYDSLTARIAQHLYPNQTIVHAGLQDVPLPEGKFALAIGNPPFGKESLYFRNNPALQGKSIHNQFFLQSLHSLAEDGVMGMVVSHNLMDAQDQTARMAMAIDAEFLGGIRLPDTAFKENARTEVVTDILYFRKRNASERKIVELTVAKIRTGKLDNKAIFEFLGKGKDASAPESEIIAVRQRVEAIEREMMRWVPSSRQENFAGSGETISVNPYFLQNPRLVIGVMNATGTMNARADLNVVLDDPATMAVRLDAAIEALPQRAPVDAVAERTMAQFDQMAEAMRLAVNRAEPGAVRQAPDGRLLVVVEMDDVDTSNRKSMLSEIELTADTPFSEEFSLRSDGKWLREENKLDDAGNPIKRLKKDGTPSNLNEKVITAYDNLASIPERDKWGQDRIALVRDMLPLRDAFKRQMVLESSDAPAGMMEDNRARLNKLYGAFTAKHGSLHKRATEKVAMTMPDGALVLALEEVGKDGSTKPAAILSRRVTIPPKPVERVQDSGEAVAVVLAERGNIDLDRVAQLLGTDAKGAEAALSAGDSPRAFFDPETNQWEPADGYLSGMVRRKLLAAKAAGLEANVAALEKVQPEPWDSSQVTPTMGSNWIPEAVYADFLRHLGFSKGIVLYSPVTNTFTVDAKGQAKAEWATSERGLGTDEIVQRMLNSKPMRVMVPDGEGGLVFDEEGTTETQMKAREIGNEFMEWAFADDDRREDLVQRFNEKFNTRVVRQRDGSHLTLPGKVPDSVIKMRPWQLNAIWRGITDNAVLYDHAVGAGKTFTAIARAMERRRMGLSKKPMIVVPNHLVEQWAADARKLYPGANILAATKDDFEKQRRRRLFARIGAGDYDMVIVGHSSFGFIDIDPATEERYLDEELRIAYAAVKEAEEAAAAAGFSGFGKPMGVAQAEQLVKKLEERLAKVRDNTRDRLLTFEQMGIDDLTVDEAHEFKNLAYTSNLQGVAGMGNKTGSGKAMDLNLKIRSLKERPGTSVAFLTGTPISNSVAEMYLVLRNLVPKELAELGMENFDAWRINYVTAADAYEPTESGSLKEVTRLGREWSNMRSLMELYYTVADAVTLQDMKDDFAKANPGKSFPVPRVRSQLSDEPRDREMVAIKPSEQQREILRDIVSGFNELPDIKDRKERNIARLQLMDRARKVSLDARAVDPRIPVPKGTGKIGAVVDRAFQIYEKTADDRGTQLIFLDRSVPKAKGDDAVLKAFDKLVADLGRARDAGEAREVANIEEKLQAYNINEINELRAAQAGGWNAYQEIKDQLVAKGVPASEIRFVQEANTDQQKADLFKKVNSGEVRILIGSTPRMGAGTNVQERLVALHHVDVTWKPSDIEQREGRIVRQQNKLLEKYGPEFTVDVIAYATEMTVDAKMWSLNATKLKAINGVRKYDGAFNMEFDDEESAGMAEMAALATGNPLMVERVVLDGDIKKLEMAQRSFNRRVSGIKSQLRKAEMSIENGPAQAERLRSFAKEMEDQLNAVRERSAQRRVTVDGKEYTNDAEALLAATKSIDEQHKKAGNDKARYVVDINGESATSRDRINALIAQSVGDKDFEMEVNGKTIIDLSSAVRAIMDLHGDASTRGREFTIPGLKINGMRVDLDVSPSRWRKDASLLSLVLMDRDGVAMYTRDHEFDSPVLSGASVRAALTKMLAADFNPGRYSEWADDQDRTIARAKRDLPDLKEQAAKTFPREAELKEKRGRLAEVITLLQGTSDAARLDDDAQPGATNDAPTPTAGAPDVGGAGAVFSSADATLPAKPLSLNRVNQLVQEALSGIRGAPPVEVTARPADVGLQVPAGSVGYGVTLRSGDIYVFQSAMGSDLDVFKTVFHELFHRGVRVLVPKGQYVQTMLDLAKGDSRIQQLAIEWKNTEMGQKQKENLRKQGYTGSELTGQYEALAIEEALAAVAEEIKAEGRLGSKPKNMTIRFLANWLAKVADLAGMKKLAQAIRTMTYNEAERFVMSAIDRSGEPVQAGRTDNLSAKQAAQAGDQTQTEAFKRWFGDSKVVDADGKPLVVYHGSSRDIEIFAAGADEAGQSNGNRTGAWGSYFTPSAEEASIYAEIAGGDSPQNVVPVYLAIRNPYVMNRAEWGKHSQRTAKAATSAEGRADAKAVRAGIEALGHDGIVIRDRGFNDEWVAFRPEQIKSAIGNNGNFDPSNADIRFRSADLASRAGMASLKASALDQIHQALTHPGKVSLWDKTVGTMRHLAERAPAFKPVFESAQRFIDDVSTLANDAADMAPRLLPRVESMSDLKKKPITAEDNKALARPLFEGTLLWARDVDGKAVLVRDLEQKYASLSAEAKGKLLVASGRLEPGVMRMWQGLPLEQFENLINSRFESQMLKAGVVWKASELQSMFGLNEQQVSLYQEARKAIDRSIDMTARADMLRALGAGYAALRDVVLELPTMFDAMDLITSTLQQEAKGNPDGADRLMALNNAVVSRYEKARDLQAMGYAPLSRFGRYTLDVVDQAGERQYFGMFDSMLDSNRMKAAMEREFPGATVTQGTMSAEAYKLFQGITPESLELFGNMLGLDEEGSSAQDQAFQQYLQLAKNNHSALKRLIHRKGIAGYSEDVGRVLASFVYSNARQAAGGLNAGTMEQAINNIPKDQGELKDVAVGLQSYIRDPQEEGQAVRGMLFAQYLGGSLASAFVNMTQPFAVTMPWLSQFGGMKKAGAQLARAVKEVGAKDFKGEPDLARALQHAVEDGTVAPQEIHQLMAQARGTGSLRVGDGTRLGDARATAANNWERVKVLWGQPFALAEQYNRRSTFIAAYRIAKEQGMPAPADFARRAVLETQFLYSKANKGRFMRGAVGGTLMTFKTYSVSYLELLQRMWTQGGPEGKRAVGWAMAMLLLMGGAGGLPFMEDAEDLIDGIGQLMGYNLSAKQWRKEALRELVGKELADFMENGVSGMPGAPIDVSGRLGMGNLIPGTGLLLSKQNRERDLLEIAGPAGDLVSRGFTGMRKALTGDLAGAALEVSPTAVRNVAKGVDMATTGMYRDAKGYKVIDSTLDEAIAKAIGFQPKPVAEVQEANSFMQRSKNFYIQTSSEIKAQWAQALFEKDDAALERVRERLADWNRDNPEQPIVVKMPDVWKKVREMGKDRTQRIAETAPKALREEMRREAATIR